MRDINVQYFASRIKVIFPRRNTPIARYHQVERASRDKDPFYLCVSPETFDRQMKFLSESGFRSISLDELTCIRNGSPKYVNKTFVLTFDDGYLDNYTNAFPVLLKYGLTATVFLISDRVGTIVSWDMYKPRPLMTWEHVREMSKHGISFQSHTCTHPDLTTLDDKSVSHELIDSKKKIEDVLGLPVRHFAYPSGRYDERIIELVEKAGYQSAYATNPSLGSRFAIERFRCNTFGLKFKMETCAWNNWLRHVCHLPQGIWNMIRKIHCANC